MTSRDEHSAVWLATLNTSRIVLTTKDNKKDDSYPDCYCRFQLRGYAKRHEWRRVMVIATRADVNTRSIVRLPDADTSKKGYKFTDPDGEFPRVVPFPVQGDAKRHK